MRRFASLFLTASALVGAAAAQSPPTAQPQNTRPIYDPDQLPAVHGVAEQFTLTPRGDVDGLILADGTEVKTPPHLSTQIAYTVKLGDAVTIHGLRAAALPLVQAVSIADDANGRVVVDNSAKGLGGAPPPRGWNEQDLAELQGHVRMALHGPQGDVNGALMDDGVVLRLPPPEAGRFATLLQNGQSLVAEGVRTTTPLGTVFDAREIGQSEAELTAIGPGDHGRRPPPPPPPGVGAPPPPPPDDRP